MAIKDVSTGNVDKHKLGGTPPEPLEWFIPHLIPPRLLICHLLVCADPRRRPNFDPLTSRIDLVGLGRLLTNPGLHRLFDTQRAVGPASGLELQGPQPYANQLWGFQDMGGHGGVGFMIEMFFAAFRSLEDKSMTPESKRLIGATLRAIIDNGKSEYFKTAGRRFLWSLRQEINVLWESTPEETRTPPKYILWLLLSLFEESDEDQPKEEENNE
ncbi:hypothetical protein BYT27DRAFT_6473940 [Phlegmacium glaucopus]|nr:hypothetical protein BYT27DRAFT_6473940 [Phlegmacium glaucopus]